MHVKPEESAIVSIFRLMAEKQVRLLIRIPASLKAKLVEIAERERRSLNRQIEFLLDGCVRNEMKDEVSGPLHPKGGRRHGTGAS